MVLWWVPAGHVLSVDEAKARLELLGRRGAGPDAFTFQVPFPRPGLVGTIAELGRASG